MRVCVDAGHGGEDPGAAGSRYRTREKKVTLEIARRLKRLIDAQPGMRAELTRTGDYYVGLRKRMALARKHRADLFVSIHADAFRDKRVRGSSVYVLSQRGASSEAARWLAESENSADLVGGVEAVVLEETHAGEPATARTSRPARVRPATHRPPIPRASSPAAPVQPAQSGSASQQKAG